MLGRYLQYCLFSWLFANLIFADTPIVIRPEKVQYEFKGPKIIQTSPRFRPKIGLVLSGGGARSVAQVGVLRIFEKYNVPVDLIVGNSLGSVIGGLYAAGYSSSQIESILVRTNWDEMLPYSEGAKRQELFVGQKQTEPVGYLLIRFDGIEPIIPSALSGGQRLLNYLTTLTLQALYHPNPSFDDLKIPFRTVATDLLTGQRIVLEQGSLAEAMRSSITVPLLYSPVEEDSLLLVDGGLRSNIPVDVAKSLGCDIVVVVNSTSGMRQGEQLNEPWEIADQIMTIMMQEANEIQLQNADVVISPEVGNRLASDFDSVEVLIRAGEIAAEEIIVHLQALIREKTKVESAYASDTFHETEIEIVGDSLPSTFKQDIEADAHRRTISPQRILQYVNHLMHSGRYQDVCVEILPRASPTKIIFHLTSNPVLKEIRFTGNTIIPSHKIEEVMKPCQGKPIDYFKIQECFEQVLLLYREEYLSLARIESVSIDTVAGSLYFTIEEGVLEDVRFRGNKETKDYVIRREFELERGDVFKLDKVSKGLVNIASTGLFEYVMLDVQYEWDKPVVYLKVKEKSSELLTLGVHARSGRGLVGTIAFRNINFRGAGEDLGLLMRYGIRDRIVRAEYRANRIFRTYFTFNLKTYFNSRDVITYREVPTSSKRTWRSEEDGEYRELKYGSSVTFGAQLERLGDFTSTIRIERHRISGVSGGGYDPDNYRYVSLKVQSTIDTENQFYFPTEGIQFLLSYEYSSKSIGSEVSFNKIGMMYESYLTFGERHTIKPQITLGAADITLPLAEMFSLGGQESFMGLREDDRYGRQLFLVNFKYRYWLPFKILFETYLGFRYDLGMISKIPQELKFSQFRHGVGIELSLDTPVGPAAFAVGKSFYLLQDVITKPVSVGPLVFYFSIGPNF